MTRVTVVVLSWNGADLLPRCLDAALAQQVDGGAEVWVVDNGSTDRTVELVRSRYPAVRLVQTGANLGFAGGNNVALRLIDTDFVALLNNDAVPEPGWLAALVTVADTHPEVAAVTGKVLLDGPAGSAGVVNSAGGWVDALGHGRDRGFRQPDDGRWDAPAEVFYAPATACLYRTAAVHRVGLLDDDFFLYYEDVDLSWRLRLAGWAVRYTPDAVVRHAHSATAVSGSPLHIRCDARNRLLTVVKCAPIKTAVHASLRLPVTAAGFAVRGEPARAARVLQGWLSFLRLLPRALAARRRIGRSAVVSRAALDRVRVSLGEK
ncbi:MAG TPA: glycosyltransferase family 2 protein [Mycobacteriales bacterium]|nr:glycosyltransferase family 2 protein [Mycobacteriales bacterium]